VACAATFAGERQSQFALAYLRLALRLDPERDEAWMLVGDLLNQGDDRKGAIEAFNHITPSSPHYQAAQGKLAWTYQESGDKARALDDRQGVHDRRAGRPRRPGRLGRPAARQ
jgi:predicted Zn-dependent protease